MAAFLFKPSQAGGAECQTNTLGAYRLNESASFTKMACLRNDFWPKDPI